MTTAHAGMRMTAKLYPVWVAATTVETSSNSRT